MLRRVVGSLAVAGSVLAVLGAAGQSGLPAAGRAPSTRQLLASSVQWGISPAPAHASGRYVLQRGQTQAVFHDTGLTLHLPSRAREGQPLGWGVVGGRAVTPQADKPREAKLHRFVGPREEWQRDVPTYGGLRYPGVLPGVDLWLEERAEGLEYGLRAEHGEALRRVQLEYTGARKVRVVEAGQALEVELGEGRVREQGLKCEQPAEDGTAHGVGCRFADARQVGQDRWEYAIEVDVEDPERPVVVDPVISWNSFLGDPGEDNALWDIQQNSSGETFVIGTVGREPMDLPPLLYAYGSRAGSTAAFVASVDPEGKCRWAALIGGEGSARGRALVIGASGELYIAGSMVGKFEWVRDGSTMATLDLGNSDAFVARLSRNGERLEWVERFGGGKDETVHALLRVDNDTLYAAGGTNSPLFTGALNGPAVQEDGFVSRINLSPSPFVAWTVLVSSDSVSPTSEQLNALTYDGDDVLYATGYVGDSVDDVSSHDMLLAAITSLKGSTPMLARRVLASGSQQDEGVALRLVDGGSGLLQVWGTTASPDLDNKRALGGADIFMLEYKSLRNDSSMPLQRSVLLGSASGEERLTSLTVDDFGQLYIGGTTTSSTGLPVQNGFNATYGGGSRDGLVAKVQMGSTPSLEWASYFGGDQQDAVHALRVHSLNRNILLFGGSTLSKNVFGSPNGNPAQPNPSANSSLFLASADLAMTGGGLDAGVIVMPDAGVIVIPTDAGVIVTPDAGTGTPDAGTGTPDAGTGTPDAGAGMPDAGTGMPDAGADMPDAGAGKPDAGAGKPDAGMADDKPPRSPVGYSCGAGSTTSGGTGWLTLAVLGALRARASRRRGDLPSRE